MTLVVWEQQVAAIPAMKQHIKPTAHYTEIVPAGNVVKRCDESRALLALGARTVYPGHTKPYAMPAALEAALEASSFLP